MADGRPLDEDSDDAAAWARALEDAEALRRGGRPAEAVARYADALLVRPGDAAVWNNLALALLGDGRPEDALAAAELAAALASDPVRAAIDVTRGNALAQVGAREASAAAYRRAIARSPALFAAHYQLGARLFDDRDLEPARACFERALEIDPTHADARFHFALCLLLAGDETAAEAALAPLEADNPRVDGLRWARSVATARTRWFADPFEVLGFGLAAARDDGLVLELGVRRGTSIRWLAARLGPAVRVHGFDSFEGLPVPWGELPEGTYGVGGELPEVPPSVAIHVGWFADTLPPFLAANAGPVRIVNVDCDVHRSTKEALDLLADRLVPGAVLVFDDYLGYRGWRDGEHRALCEIIAARGLDVEPLAFAPFTHQAVMRVRGGF